MLKLDEKEYIISLSRILNKQTEILKSTCKIIWASIYTITFYIIVYFVIIKVFHHYMSVHILLLILCIHIILTIIAFKRLRQYIRKTRINFIECKNLSNKISDGVDWGIFRKRQLYKQLYPNIQNALDNFFYFRNSKLCLFSEGKRLFHKIYLTDFMLTEISVIYTVLSMFNFEIFGIKL